MMGDMHHMHRGIMSLEAPLCEVDTGDHSFRESWNAPYSYPQILSHSIGVPCMSWSATDPAVLSIEQNSVKPPFSWQTESCLQQYTHGGYSAMGSPMEMISALNADSYNPNELSQMVQLYSSLYQDQYGYPNLSFMDPTADLLLPTSSECLQVVSLSSGSDSLSTTETWSSGGCAPNYDQVLMNESSSVTLVGESNFLPQRQQLDVLKLDHAVPIAPVQDSWIHNQLHADVTGRSSNLHTISVTSYDALPVSSSSAPTFKRPRTWDEALQQGSSAGSDPVRYSLTSKTSLKFDCSINPLSRPISSRELRTSTRETPFQGTLSASHPIGSAYPRRLDLQEEGSRFLINGKPAATSVEPQSVAARHRRKKISERIRVLEKLIPGGNKMDTATMLDEAIEYVKFLQLQVQIFESDSLDDIPVAASTQSLNSTADKQGSKRKFDTATGGDFSAGSLRAATSPLILSEVLQQQLFKQKLCLVSIRERSSRPPPTTQTAGACAAPSILRKK